MLNFLLSPLLGLLKSLMSAFGMFQWGRERERRKAAERDAERANQIEGDVDDALDDLANDNRDLDQRLRELDGFRDDTRPN